MTTTRVPPPADAVAAATHPDPYPYYAELAARRAIERDARLGMWVAAGAAAVEAVLSDPNCLVRPPGEPVPAAIAGSPAGALFRRLVRMTDGGFHCPVKGALRAALGSLDLAAVERRAREAANALCAALAPAVDPGGVTAFCFRLPVQVVAELLGIPCAGRERVATWIADFVAGLAPHAADAALVRAADGAAALQDVVQSAIGDAWAGDLLARLATAAARQGIDDPSLVAANAVGLMMQSYEATAGLIGNSLLALARRSTAADWDGLTIQALVQDVLRRDPPIQNTRRFVAADGPVAGVPMARGDAILVVLAAAGREGSEKPAGPPWALGRARHACPGGALAATIAAAGVGALLDWGVDVAVLAGSFRYRPSANARVPVWDAGTTPSPGEARCMR